MSATLSSAAPARAPRSYEQKVRLAARVTSVLSTIVCIALYLNGAPFVPTVLATMAIVVVVVRFEGAWLLRFPAEFGWRDVALDDGTIPHAARGELAERLKELAWLGFEPIGVAATQDPRGPSYAAAAEHPRTFDLALVVVNEWSRRGETRSVSRLAFVTQPAEAGPLLSTAAGMAHVLPARPDDGAVHLPGLTDPEALFRVHRWRLGEAGPGVPIVRRDVAAYMAEREARVQAWSTSRGLIRADDGPAERRLTIAGCLRFVMRTLPPFRWVFDLAALRREHDMVAAAAATDIAL